MKPDRSPTSRALMLVELLQDHPGITADELAVRLGVSSRAVRRYVEILREAEIPVESMRGPGGGYRLGRGVRLPPLVFTATEALGLVMAVLDGHHPAADAEDPVGSALGKLLRALPSAVATQARAVRGAAAPVPDRFAARPDPQLTVQLVEACAERTRTKINYRSEAGTVFDPVVEPWAVLVRHSRWYLLCHNVDIDAVRAFRVDRIRGVERLPQTFVPPADLDPVEALESHLALGWEYSCSVIIDRPVADLASWLPRSVGRLEAVEHDRARLVASTSNPTWYAEQLVRLSVPFHVEGGPELIEAVAGVGRRLRDALDPPTDQ